MAYSETRQCEWCGAVFHPTRRWQTFCTTKCRGLNANERRKQGTAALLAIGSTGFGVVGLTVGST